MELPVVIRPRVLCLTELEQRARTDGVFALALAAQPEFRRCLARAVHVRDDQARRRFPSVEALDGYLRGLLAG